jgi:DNA topoisomerase-2
MTTSVDLSVVYQSKTDREHILHAPDTYIGSIDKSLQEMDVYDVGAGRVLRKLVEFVPGLYKLFDEGIVNARDHAIRMLSKPDGKQVSYIRVSVADDGLITIENDGNGIDVAKHPTTGLWIPEMIFGHLRTSTNYNTEEKKIVGGKNGFGFKVVLIWSVYGQIETVDHTRGLKYIQKFGRNLESIGAPEVSKVAKTVKPYTRVSFRPDYARFGVVPTGSGSNAEGKGSIGSNAALWRNFVELLHKRTIDIAACTDAKVKVYFNDALAPVKSFNDFWTLYNPLDEGQTAGQKRVYESMGPRWEYAVCLSTSNEFKQVSFVNGIATFKGGRHVDYILGQIVKGITETIEKKRKIKVSPQSIKEQILLFLRCDIENPAFDSQTKEFMTTPVGKFGSVCEVSPAFIKKVMDLGVADIACEVSELRENKAAARKANGSKVRTIRGIANFSDAIHAGSNRSAECTLILCEGLSAMAGIVSGLTKEDTLLMGIYPLKGKLLNVRDMPTKRITENKEIGDIIKILGLELGKDYSKEEAAKSLRYGKIMIMCDQDVDGSHIKGLCINLFQSHWRTLFGMTGFLSFMNTPILRATRRNEVKIFYNQVEYESWKALQEGSGGTGGWTIKYFKGLGTSTAKEFKEYFANRRVISYAYSGSDSDESIDRMFNKKRPDDRKTLLENYDKSLFLDGRSTSVPYEDFVQKELLHFSSYDCERSIPNLLDGLKTSNRKVLFACFKRGLTSQEIKVAQLSGYVSEHTLYHHGEASLNGAIVAMAQNFVGSNNIHLLEPNGQFGSRLAGGEDSASERYIFTLLNPLTRLLFPAADDAVLTYLDEDGVGVEPEYYVPLLPMILVNGSTGIGTGFSTHVPSFSPKQLVAWLRNSLQGTPQGGRCASHVSSGGWLPYYQGFKGSVSAVDDSPGKFLVRGCYEHTGKPDQIRITELPVGTWTLPYKAWLESLCDASVVDKDGKKVPCTIKDVVSHSTDTVVDMIVDLLPGKLAEWESTVVGGGISLLEKTLKLTTTVATTNMHLFDADRRLRKYVSVDDILAAYVPVRLALYGKRKAALLLQGEAQLLKLRNKARYIQLLLDGVIDLRRKTNAQVAEMLRANKFDEQSGEGSGSKGYDYLTKMPMDSVSEENRLRLLGELEKWERDMAVLRGKTEQQLWLEELDLFETEYDRRLASVVPSSTTGSVVAKKPTIRAKK